MSLSILTNVSAMQTEQNLLNSSNNVASAEQDLSSGLRINSAADDAAGFAISEGMTSQINGLTEASDNAADATSMVQTASSSLTDVQNMLQRVYELGVEYNNGTNSTTDKSDIQDEVNQLTQEINREQTSSNFNGINLLDGTAGGGTSATVTFQVGADDGDTMTVTLSNVETTALVTGFSWGTNGATASSGGTVFSLSQANALADLTTAINNVSSMAASLGAVQNRLQYTSDSISSTQTNLTSTNSTITDVNMADEMTTLSQQQVLEQAGEAMLSQAQTQPQIILKLLQSE
jgi:flagellin